MPSLAPKAIICSHTTLSLQKIAASESNRGIDNDELRRKMAGFAVGADWNSDEFYQLFERCIGHLSSNFTTWRKVLLED